MKVRILFFASLREQLGTSGEEIELPAGVTTVAGLRSHLKSRGGAFDKGIMNWGDIAPFTWTQLTVTPDAPLRVLEGSPIEISDRIRKIITESRSDERCQNLYEGFKEEAIKYAWDLITGVVRLALARPRLYAAPAVVAVEADGDRVVVGGRADQHGRIGVVGPRHVDVGEVQGRLAARRVAIDEEAVRAVAVDLPREILSLDEMLSARS